VIQTRIFIGLELGYIKFILRENNRLGLIKKLFMSNSERLRLLKEFIAEEPENPFNFYALALEIRDFDQQEAGRLFDLLLLNHPDYLPVYFPSAHFFFELGQIEKAKNIFEQGIDLAKSQKAEKTLKELQNAYQNFLFENDLD
jgi:tetratricopeptide (TPR) repeat protein